MKAIVISQPGDASVLVPTERIEPVPASNEVRISVKAAGLNRADLLQREGRYPAPAGVVADVPGLEVAGIIDTCGSHVSRWNPGDRVCALVAGGGYAEFVTVDERHCLPIPEGFDFCQASALPEAVFTVWLNVFQRGKLQSGERILVHGGSSGIGTTAIQMAKAVGCDVLATAGSERKVQACSKLGASRAINYRNVDFSEAFADEKCDMILDMVGGNYLARNLSLLRADGRLVLINAVQGRCAEIDLMALISRSLTVSGCVLRSRSTEFKAALAKEVETQVWPMISRGLFHPVIDQIFPFAEAAVAHRHMESSEHIGKIILAMEDCV